MSPIPPPPVPPPGRPGLAARAYLLRETGPDDLAAYQRRLVYDISGDPTTAAVVLTDHPPHVTVGRHGSAAHIQLTAAELVAREWPVRWVARGGGVHLHVPGQVGCYPVLPVAPLEPTPAGYVAALAGVLADLARSFGLTPECCPHSPAVTVRGRAFAMLGVAVRHGVAGGGIVVNVAPDLALFRGLAIDAAPAPMTSLQRECSVPVRVASVRQQLLDLLAARFIFNRLTVFHHAPTFLPRTACHAIQPAPRR